MSKLALEQHKVILPALFWSKRRADFYAVTDDVCREGIQFRSATTPFVSEILSCSIRGVALVDVRVVRGCGNLFTVKLLVGPEQSSAIVSSLIECGRRQRFLAPILVPGRDAPDRTDVSLLPDSAGTKPGRLIGG